MGASYHNVLFFPEVALGEDQMDQHMAGEALNTGSSHLWEPTGGAGEGEGRVWKGLGHESEWRRRSV